MMHHLIGTLMIMALFLSACATPGTPLPQHTTQSIAIATLPPAATAPPAPTETPVPSPSSTPEPAKPSAPIAYTGLDANIWLLNPADGSQKQVTGDGTSQQLDQKNNTVRYCCSIWSSDGKLLAFQVEKGKPISSGYQYEFSVEVYDTSSSQVRSVLENLDVAGYAWKPGTHLLTYGQPADIQYFMHKSGPSPEYAKGIWAVDADAGGDPYELVKPERGYSLVNPTWSEDGRFMSFDEVLAMEGRGQFAYYDFTANQYVAWDKVIGMYAWSPDGEKIAYDNMAYTPTGTERIYLRDRAVADEQPFSPQFDRGYAYSPVFSPAGDQLAYLAELTPPDSNQFTLFVQPIQGGEARQLGTFEQANALTWSADGASLLLSVGPYEGRQVIKVMVSDGSVQTLANGYEPAEQPSAP